MSQHCTNRLPVSKTLSAGFLLALLITAARAGDASMSGDAATYADPPAPAAAPAAPRPSRAPESVQAPNPPEPPMAPDEARLDAARQRLEQAAQEVAQLSLQLGNVDRTRLLIDMGGPGVTRAVLGVQIDPAGGKGGARVSAVSPGGPAALGGVQQGDVIVSLGTANLAEADNGGRALVENMRGIPPDKPLKLRIVRAGKALDLTVTPRATALLQRGSRPMPHIGAVPHIDGEPAGLPGADPMMLWRHDLPGGVAGMELATLTPKLGQYFGADKGVLVLRAPSGTGWKLEDGDVITSIDGRTPNSGAHATRILSSYQPGEKISIKLLRQRKALSLDIATPAQRETLVERTIRIDNP